MPNKNLKLVPYSGGGTFGPIATPTLTTSVISGTEIDLTLAYVPGPVATSYVFESSPQPLGPFTSIGSGASPLFSNTGLSPGTVYYYRGKVKVVDGRFSQYTNTVASTTQPTQSAVPQNVSATTVDYQSISVNWDAVSGADSYNVYVNGANPLNSVTNSSIVTGLTTNTSYTFTVSAVSSSFGEGPQSSPAVATTANIVPTAPVINVVVLGNSSIRVDLVTPSQEPIFGIDHYNIRRSQGSTNVNPIRIASIGGDQFPYTDTGLAANTQYNYQVFAYSKDPSNPNDVSSGSNVDSATTQTIQTGNYTLLLYDDQQTIPFSIQPQSSNASNYTWARADDYNYAFDPSPSSSTNHARVGSQSTRFQITFTQNKVGNNYTQWVSNNGSTTESAHRIEANITGLGAPFAPTGWDRTMHRRVEYWIGHSVFVPGVNDSFGEDFPVTPWPGYLILFQFHDSGGFGSNPVFTISLDSSPLRAGTNRTNWSLTSSSSPSPTRDGTVGHTSKAYLLHPWGPDAGHWVDFVIRYKPDYTQATGVGSADPCQGILQVWMSCETLGEDSLVLSQPAVGTVPYGFPNSGINQTGTDSSPYALPAAFYTPPATPSGIPGLTSPSQGVPSLNAPPPTNYPHQLVNYFGWSRVISTTSNPQAAVDSTNFAYQAVKTPGNRHNAR